MWVALYKAGRSARDIESEREQDGTWSATAASMLPVLPPGSSAMGAQRKSCPCGEAAELVSANC